MAFEIINYLSATPNRVYAMLELIYTFKDDSLTRDQIKHLLQPDSIQENKQSSDDVFRVIQNLGFVTIQDNDETIKILRKEEFRSFADFRLLMQGIVLGVTQPEDNNFLLNQFTTWYASYGHRVFEMRRDDMETRFHDDLYPSIVENIDETRKVQHNNSLLSWGLWARFLGFGKEYALPRPSKQRKLMPNAYERIMPFIPKVLPHDGSEITINEFLQELGSYCPELDGGSLYKNTYKAIHNSDSDKSNISLMLSTALRTLFSEGLIELIDRADAKGKRQLFPSQSYNNLVSHICLTEEMITQ